MSRFNYSRYVPNFSRFNYSKYIPNILKLGFLKSPDKNLVVLDCEDTIIGFYILSDKNPGPIKFQLDNKLRFLVFSEVSEFKCNSSIHSYTLTYTLAYFTRDFEKLVYKSVGNRSGILSRWSGKGYIPMQEEDKDRVNKFYETFYNETS